jgi:hypothetical protein
MDDTAQHLAASVRDETGSVALERVTEGIVNGDEEPGVTAHAGQRAAGAVRERVGVAVEMKAERRAELAGDVGTACHGDEQDAFLLPRQRLQGESRTRRRAFHDGIDVLGVDPRPRDGNRDVRLVLMIGGEDLDLG